MWRRCQSNYNSVSYDPFQWLQSLVEVNQAIVAWSFRWTNSHWMCGDGGCWYPNNFGDFRGGLIFKRLPVGLVTQRMRMGISAADSRLHTAATTATSWPGSLITNSQPSTQQESTEWRLKYKVNIYIMFCIRIIIEPYHFVMLLEAEDTGLQFYLILSWPLLSREKA